MTQTTGNQPALVEVFDTTLRDGEQAPGATLNKAEKLEIARQLAKLGVDYVSMGALTHSARAMDLSLEILTAAGKK